jgi:hypothetical protein
MYLDNEDEWDITQPKHHNAFDRRVILLGIALSILTVVAIVLHFLEL